MGFRVIYKGLEVICDSFEDLDFLAERASQTRTPALAVSRKPEPIVAQEKQPNLPITNGNGGLVGLVNSLPSKTIDLLSVLVANGSMADKALREQLGLDNNMQIAGRVSPISRQAKKFDLKPEAVLVKHTVSNKPGHRKYEYYVPETAHEIIRRQKAKG